MTQLDRYYQFKKNAIKQLGGKCNFPGCEKTTTLEFDHIDPTTKIETICKMWDKSSLIQAELAKCQLLCRQHHNEKTIKEAGKLPAKGTDRHGTLSMYRYCKCELCVKANTEWSKEWRKRKHTAYE